MENITQAAFDIQYGLFKVVICVIIKRESFHLCCYLDVPVCLLMCQYMNLAAQIVHLCYLQSFLFSK